MAMNRYACPNDSEVLIVHIDSSTNPPTEDLQCPFCHYKSTKANAQAALKTVADTYVPPSKTKR